MPLPSPNEEWLDDYALYMALKAANGMKNWVEWDKLYRLRDKKALAAFAAENEEEIGFWKFVQYKFAAQWQAVKAYANKKGRADFGRHPHLCLCRLGGCMGRRRAV